MQNSRINNSVSLPILVKLSCILLLFIFFFLCNSFLNGRRIVQAQDNLRTYTIVAGDTLLDIATRFGVEIETLAELNNIEDAAFISIGQVLLIPNDNIAEEAEESLDSLETITIQARPGDMLSTLAARYAQDVGVLEPLNGLAPETPLFPGQPILIPRDAYAGDALRFGSIRQVSVPDSLIQGDTGKVFVESTRPLSLKATWNGLSIDFEPIDSANPLIQQALIPVDALLEPGTYEIVVAYSAANNVTLNRRWSTEVQGGNFLSQDIFLNAGKNALLEAEIRQNEIEYLAPIWAEISPELYARTQLSLPINSEYPTTSPYGTRRSYDSGPYDTYHSGQDFAGPEGAPIIAPAAGIVIMAEPLEVRGNAVIVDHGRGILTGYWHMSEMKVIKGQQVNTGELLGLVGTTGLSTGAHLHWELRIYGVAVNPMQFIEEPFIGPSN